MSEAGARLDTDEPDSGSALQDPARGVEGLLHRNARHNYSDQLFRTVSDYCRETVGELNLAVDVGCGRGDSTTGFCSYFNQVIGVDIRASQIARAPRNIPNCAFLVGYSHNLPFIESGTVDLFCCGEAFQYMPFGGTLLECDRVLRPGGTFAVFGYRRGPRAEDQAIDKVLLEIFQEMLPYLGKEEPLSFTRYQGGGAVSLPNWLITSSPWTRKENIRVRKRKTVGDFTNNLRRFSVVQAILIDEPDFLEDVERKLRSAINASNTRPDNGDHGDEDDSVPSSTTDDSESPTTTRASAPRAGEGDDDTDDDGRDPDMKPTSTTTGDLDDPDVGRRDFRVAAAEPVDGPDNPEFGYYHDLLLLMGHKPQE